MKIYILILTIIILGMSSCSEEWMSDVIPTNNKKKIVAIKTMKDARNAVNGIFSVMQSENYYGAKYFQFGTLKGTDVKPISAAKRGFGMYSYYATEDAANTSMWSYPYKCLASVNNALLHIDNLKEDKELNISKDEVKANLYALRALNHFDLLRIFAHIPASVDDVSKWDGVVLADHVIAKTEQPKRSKLKECYDFVISDLTKALGLMPDKVGHIHWFNKASIQALLSRVYLYNGNNQESYDMAKAVIGNKQYSLIKYGEYRKSWEPEVHNPESLLAIINTDSDDAGLEGIGYLWNKEGYKTMCLTKSFQEILLKNKADDRINALVKDGSLYYSRKFPMLFANKLHIIRLSEMYFNAAEAAFKLGEKAEAADLINAIIEARTNEKDKIKVADLSDDIDGIKLIIKEKRKEFVGEGHNFFDFIRNKLSIERDPSDLFPGAPQTIKLDNHKIVQPIPRRELEANKNMIQNPGY